MAAIFPTGGLESHQLAFIELLVRAGALTFGDFVAKSGRRTPYFIDTGRLRTGEHLEALGGFYADTIEQRLGRDVDVLFGPAYKGIPLVVAASMALARRGHDVGFCFDRKEAKDHGEGGRLVGWPPRDGDRVLLVDDVTTAGTSVRAAVPLLRAAADVRLVGLVVGVDRQERGRTERAALAELAEELAMPAFGIVTIEQIVGHLAEHDVAGRRLITGAIGERILDYWKQYRA